MQSIENKTSARIYGNQSGWAFSKIDFLVCIHNISLVDVQTIRISVHVNNLF